MTVELQSHKNVIILLESFFLNSYYILQQFIIIFTFLQQNIYMLKSNTSDLQMNCYCLQTNISEVAVTQFSIKI